jgi:NAD-dependent deacetylase
MKNKINVVFFTGAGISAESGIPTFRDSDGLWEGHDVMKVAHIDSWRSKVNRDYNRELMLNFYNQRRRDLKNVEPNDAHYTISVFENSDKFSVHVITQNVDNLHERAGSCKVLHLHGELTKARSTFYDHKKSLLDTVTDIGYNDINLGDKCSVTGSQLRPHIVWFGEDVPMWADAIKLIVEADVIVIIGTSMQVYPAATVLDYVEDQKIIFVNPVIEDAIKTNPRYVCFEEKASIGVKKATDYIQNFFK